MYESAFDKLRRDGMKSAGLKPPVFPAEQMPAYMQNHPGQAEVWKADERFIGVVAGWQSGKSVTGPPWLLREIQRRGPGDYMIITPDFSLLEKKALPEFLKLFEHDKEKTKGFGTYLVSKYYFEFSEEGSVSLFGEFTEPTRVYMAHAQKPESVEAATVKAIWADEPGQFPDSIWEAMNARGSVNQARMLLTSRPYTFNWYKTEIWDKKDAPDVKVVNFRSVDNPAFPQAEWDRQKKLMPSWKFDMKYGGIFTRPGGSVYEDWDEEWGVVEPFEIPVDWVRTWGVDFGQTHTACVKCATDPRSGIDYWYEEYENGNMPSWMHVKNLKRTEPHGFHAMACGGAPSEDAYRNEWCNAGLNVQKPNIKDVEVGIDRTQALIKAKKQRVFSTCTKIRHYLQNYSWETDEHGEPIPGKIKDKSTWHVGDGVRYRNVQFSSEVKQEVEVYSRLDLEEENELFVFSTW